MHDPSNYPGDGDGRDRPPAVVEDDEGSVWLVEESEEESIDWLLPLLFVAGAVLLMAALLWGCP